MNRKEERRKSVRVNFPCRIQIYSSARVVQSHTENISEDGVRVLLDERLNIYTSVGLELFLTNDKFIRCNGQVIWILERMNPIDKKPVLFDTGIKITQINEADKQYLKRLIETIILEDKNRVT